MESSPTPTVNVPPVAPPAEALSYRTSDPLQVPPDWTNVEVFALDLPKLAAYNRMSMLITVGMMLFAWTVVAWMIYFSDSLVEDRWVLISKAAIRLAIFGVCMELFFRWRRRKSWNSFRLAIADQGLVQCSGSAARIIVTHEQVVRVRETLDTLRLLLTSGRFIVVPKRVADLDRVRTRLEKWAQIERGSGIFGIIVVTSLHCAALATILLAYWLGNEADDPFMIGYCIVLSTSVIAIAIWNVFRDKNSTLFLKVVVFLLFYAPVNLAIRLLLLMYHF